MTDSESSEFEPYENFDDFAADLERFTQSQPQAYNDSNNNDLKWMKSDPHTSQTHRLSRNFKTPNMGVKDDADGRGKIAIQIKPKHPKVLSGHKDRAEVKKFPMRSPSIDEILAKFTTIEASTEFQVTPKISNTKRSTSMTQDADDVETVELFRKQRFRLASDAFKTSPTDDNKAKRSSRQHSSNSESSGLKTESLRSFVHKSHETSLTDHTKDEKRSRDSSKEINISSPRRPMMQSEDQDQIALRRKSSQPKTSLSPVINYQGPQQALGRFGMTDRKNAAKQTQQWSEQETAQPEQQKSNSLIRERVKSLSSYGNKQIDIKPTSSSRINTNSSAIQSTRVNSSSNSYNSSKLHQLTGAISSSQREKAQQGPRGGIYFPSKLQAFKSVDAERNLTRSSPNSDFKFRKVEVSNRSVQKKSPTVHAEKLRPSSNVNRVVVENNNIVWITDSATGSSDEDRIIETDSSTTTCNVIDERRRRRLVKRSKKRGQANRKSQLSQFVGREISAIESQTSDDGASRASPSVNEEIEDVISEEEQAEEELSPKENYKRARQIFEKKKPGPKPVGSDGKPLLRTVPNVGTTGYEVTEVNKLTDSGLTVQDKPCPASEKVLAMSTIHSSLSSFSAVDLENRNLPDGFKRSKKAHGRGNTFSAVAKVSKITIPSLQMRSFNPPGKYRHNSDTESYVGQSKILSDPFNLGRSRFRDNNQGFSDGEHELTARLEKNEELYNETESNSFDYSRRCSTLPRNMGGKRMKENPFHLMLPSKLKGKDYFDIQSNSQSSIEDLSQRGFSFGLRPEASTNKIQSKSAGNIGIDNSSLSTNFNPDNINKLESQSCTDSSCTLTNQSSSSATPVFSHQQEDKINKEETVFTNNNKNVDEIVTSPESNPLSPASFFPNIIAPPDNFKDFDEERPINEEVILETESSNLESDLYSKDTESKLVENDIIDNKDSPALERIRGRTVLNEENKTESSSHDRAESPRRRPSYIKAQFTDFLFGPDLPELSDLVSNETETDKGSKLVDMDEQSLLNSTSDEKDTLGQKKKRARPRIPLSLEPIKSANADLEFVPDDDKGSSTPDKILLESPDSETTHKVPQIVTNDSESVPSADVKKHEKSEIVKRRPRTILAATPMLEEIPEEKSHGSGSDTNLNRSTDSVNIKAKKNRKHGNLSQAPLTSEEFDSLEGRDSPKTEKSDKTETGYFSTSLPSTPNQLSSLDDMISNDSPTFGGINFGENETFKQSRVLKLFSDGNAQDAARSRSDPIPSNLANGQTNLAQTANEETIETKWTSNSEPNLIARDLSTLTEANETISTQEIQTEVKEVVKIHHSRTESTESTDSLRSPTGSPFDQHGFPHQRTDSQKSFSSNTSLPESPVTPGPKAKQKPDMRRHVLQNLLETEKSYVQNLSFIVSVYYKPLKRADNANVIEAAQVDEIFFQIPEILVNHEFFLEQLNNRANCWSDKQIVGDIFVSSFTKCLLMDAYSSFINHYLQARATVRLASTRPTFAKFLEQCCKEHKEKLTLQDLMIQPVQRIPRYVLIIKDMLKHTSTEHPDYGLLQLALEEIKSLAERMNKGEMEADQAEKEAEKLRDIEASIEGITDLATTSRKFIRQDLVAEIKGVITKKDRCIFLFSDLLVCATVRRRNNALRRGSLGLFSGQSATEFNRYKLLWKLPLDGTDLMKGGLPSTPKRANGDKQVERMEEDIAILSKISSMADTLLIPHQNLDMSIRELIAELNRQVSEQSQTVQPIQTTLAKIELQAQTEEGLETFVFVFLSALIKSSWEACYEDAKQKLAYAKHTFPPEFQYPLPIDKTRSGMQFTCAAPSRLTNNGDIVSEQSRGDVWVCNSDGYVGQVCVVSMVPEAQSRPCVTVCSARIQCISPVPGSKLISSNRPRNVDTRKLAGIPENGNRKKGSKSSKSLPSQSSKGKKLLPGESEDDDHAVGPADIIAFDSPDEDDTDMNASFIGGTTVFGGRMSPDGSSLGAGESVEGVDASSSDNQSSQSGDDTSDDEDSQLTENRRISMPLGSAVRRGNHGYTLKGSLDDLLSEENEEHPTMWLGTEDGSIHVYQSSDVTQVRKSKMKMQLGAVVNAILYQDHKVFVALANGELCVYKRDQGNGWEIASPQTVRVGPNGASITCIAAAAGRIWCGCQNNIILVNASTLKIESTIQVSQDSHRSVYRIVSSGLGVWISLQSSAVVRLYHATSYENLADIDVALSVHKMLAGADAIIRQHKAACLRITALLACKDLLWIGTSAGVILTNPLPTIKMNTRSLRNAPGPTGSPHGHTGHVRFLTSVEVPKSQFKPNKLLIPEPVSNRPTSPMPQRKIEPIVRDDDNSKTVTLVISGGDGYEDFRTSATSEAVGREDSTNHLLIWRV